MFVLFHASFPRTSHTHTHTHTYIYIYVCVCVCVCVCIFSRARIHYVCVCVWSNPSSASSLHVNPRQSKLFSENIISRGNKLLYAIRGMKYFFCLQSSSSERSLVNRVKAAIISIDDDSLFVVRGEKFFILSFFFSYCEITFYKDSR